MISALPSQRYVVGCKYVCFPARLLALGYIAVSSALQAPLQLQPLGWKLPATAVNLAQGAVPPAPVRSGAYYVDCVTKLPSVAMLLPTELWPHTKICRALQKNEVRKRAKHL